jgi:hypothetical protein
MVLRVTEGISQATIEYVERAAASVEAVDSNEILTVKAVVM